MSEQGPGKGLTGRANQPCLHRITVGYARTAAVIRAGVEIVKGSVTRCGFFDAECSDLIESRELRRPILCSLLCLWVCLGLHIDLFEGDATVDDAWFQFIPRAFPLP